MDNQGSSNFNPQPTTSAHDANFWNPTQETQSSQLPPHPNTQNFQTIPASANSNFVDPKSLSQRPQFNPQPAQPFQPAQPSQPNYFSHQNSSPNSTLSTDLLSKDFTQMTDEEKKEAERIARAKNRIDLLKTISLIVVSLLAVLFIGLFIWMAIKWGEANTNVQGKINVAVAEAKNELQTKLENDFEEKEKYPFLTFSGPADLGSLNFEYPKTWNLYNPDDASRGGDYNAYLNPGQVNLVADSTIMALRVMIRNEQIDRVLEDYTSRVETGEMTVSSTVVNGVNVNVYTGKLDSDLQGIVCVFKIRDKTAILQTDSSNVFRADFERILSTIRFNS